MTRQLREVKPNIIKELRALMPHRPLTYSESYTLAEKQANRALQLVGQTEPDVELGWILDLPRVELQLAPRHKMDGISGFTTFTHGKYFIMVINKAIFTKLYIDDHGINDRGLNANHLPGTVYPPEPGTA